CAGRTACVISPQGPRFVPQPPSCRALWGLDGFGNGSQGMGGPSLAAQDGTEMIAPDLETGIRQLRDLLDRSAAVVPFTGAGISTECGIPDFRSPGGIWTKMTPIDFGDFLASREMRDESWRRRFAMDEHFGGAKPGRGHRALA